uniref:Uncharacterized protein n=1 Tax=Oryzias melastigma TaxID=30732 RepID=A0A3B3DV08_ORYME
INFLNSEVILWIVFCCSVQGTEELNFLTFIQSSIFNFHLLLMQNFLGVFPLSCSISASFPSASVFPLCHPGN